MLESPLRRPENRFLYLGPFFALVILVILGLFGYWMLDRRPPIYGLTGKFVGWDAKDPRVGHIEWKGVQVRSCPGRVYRWIVNGVLVQLPSREIEYAGPIDKPDHEQTTWHITFTLPDWLDHDAAYRIRIEYVCNPMHKYQPIVVSPPDVPFTLPPGHPSHSVRPAPADAGSETLRRAP